MKTLKKYTIKVVVCVAMCLLWTSLYTQAQDQTVAVEKKADEIKLTGQRTAIKNEDLEKAKNRLEEIKVSAEKTITENETAILKLQSDRESTSSYLKKLTEEKNTYPAEEPHVKYLELLDKEIGILKEKIDAGNEQLEECEDLIAALQHQVRIYANYVSLLSSALKLNETIAATPADQAALVRQEAEIAKGYIKAAQASMKEKESLIAIATKELEDYRLKAPVIMQGLVKVLESLKADTAGSTLESLVQEKINNVLFWQKEVSNLWISIFKKRLTIAKIQYDEAIQALKSAEFNAELLAEKAGLLEEKQKTEELKRKQEELAYAKKVEEVTKKAAEVTRAETEKTIQEAAKKGEEIVQEQMITTSPEKKRVLELEAEVYKQNGMVAKMKDALITEGAQRYKGRTELKKLQADIGVFLSKGATAKDIEEMEKKVAAEEKRYSEAVNSVKSLIVSLDQVKKLLSDKLALSSEEMSNIKKEVSSFADKELAQQAINHVEQRIKAQEEQFSLVLERVNILYERLEIREYGMSVLSNVKEKLQQMKAANIWKRDEVQITTQTFDVIYLDVINLPSGIHALLETAKSHMKNAAAYITLEKNTVRFWLRCLGLTSLIALFYFSNRYIRRWSTDTLQQLHESITFTYFKSRLLPSLLVILDKSITVLWVAVLCILIRALFPVKIPSTTSAMYILLYISLYTALKGFLVESFGPEKGHRKLVVSLAYISPKHIYKSLSIILLFSLISLSFITVLTVFQYKRDVIDLFWFIYRIGMLLLLLWLATQKSLFFKLLPGKNSQLGRLIQRIIGIIYPVFVVFVVSLFAIRSLGYPILTYVLLKTCIKSIVAAIIALWIAKFLLYRISRMRERLFAARKIEKNTPEEKKFNAATAAYGISLNYVASIVCAIVIVRIWMGTFRDAVDSPAAPYLIQKIFAQVGIIFRSIGNGLLYRFVMQEGRYTTPLRIIFAILVLVAFFFLARYIKKLMEERVFSRLGMERGLKHSFSNLIRYFIVAIAVLIGFNLAGIPLRSLAFFAGAFGIGIGFGMQNIISNFVSGIILLLERPMRVGDVVILDDGTLGTIEKISTRSTTMITPDNFVLTIPNSKFVEGRVTNWSLPDSVMRGSVQVGVAYGSDVALVKKCLLEIAAQNQNVKKFPEPYVRFDDFGDSSLVFKLFYWADDPGKRWFAMSEMRFSIDEVFRKNKIEIAFPQRDIHIRSYVPFPGSNTVHENNKREETQEKPQNT
ncbi:mechanosensitive ion channel domain-containing protein [uncultured Candidatus Kuenenia sp.]|uniref:mechanosensitive ion channel family protein n=1 Tax=uncultured Candidatus Kuenenia sp. TaxID=1048336 RepID=UPI0002DCCD2A|nr:mechanosensitive ion channel domain-containing protein [uncultured Candidatus Kuenenia sp.]